MKEKTAYKKIEQLMNEYIIHGEYIEKIRELLEQNVERNYELKDNFMYHTELDSYFYLVRYDNGDYNLYTKVCDAYARYQRDDKAVSVERKTKDLYPTYETLLQRSATYGITQTDA